MDFLRPIQCFTYPSIHLTLHPSSKLQGTNALATITLEPSTDPSTPSTQRAEAGLAALTLLQPPVQLSPNADPAPFTWERSHLSVLPPAHSLLHGLHGTHGAGTLCFEIGLLHPAVAFLLDHRVAGQALVPAAAFLEMVSAAVLLAQSGSSPAQVSGYVQTCKLLCEANLGKCQVGKTKPIRRHLRGPGFIT